MSAFPAQFAGYCADDDCGGRIHVGEEVIYSAVGLEHVECPTAPRGLELKPNETVCSECWLVQPCEHSGV